MLSLITIAFSPSNVSAHSRQTLPGRITDHGIRRPRKLGRVAQFMALSAYAYCQFYRSSTITLSRISLSGRLSRALLISEAIGS